MMITLPRIQRSYHYWSAAFPGTVKHPQPGDAQYAGVRASGWYLTNPVGIGYFIVIAAFAEPQWLNRLFSLVTMLGAGTRS